MIGAGLLVPDGIVKLRLGNLVSADVKILEGMLLVNQFAPTRLASSTSSWGASSRAL